MPNQRKKNPIRLKRIRERIDMFINIKNYIYINNQYKIKV